MRDHCSTTVVGRVLALVFAAVVTSATAQDVPNWYRVMTRGTASEVRAELLAGADPNAPDDSGWSPLAVAGARNPHPEVIRILVDAGADPNQEATVAGQTVRVIHIAAKSNPSPLVLRALANAGAEIDARTASGRTALAVAMQWDPYSLAGLPTSEEVEVKATHMHGDALVLAEPLPAGRVPITAILSLPDLGFSFEIRVVAIGSDRSQLTLERGPPSPPDLDRLLLTFAIDREEEPPIPSSASRFDVVETLIELGADADTRDNRGLTPLMTAVRLPDGYQIARLLLQHGGNATARSESGFTALHAAAGSVDADIRTLELLSAAGLDVNVTDKGGGTPIMEAVAFGSPLMIQTLIDAGAEPRFPEGYKSIFGADMMELARLNPSLYRDGAVIHPMYWQLNDLQFE